MHKIEFTERQLKILVVLCFAFVIMLAAISYSIMRNKDTSIETAIKYQKNRIARDSTLDSVNWENNFGGSKNESIVQSFAYKNELYFFGNTYSTDYDFDGSGKIFLAIANQNGATLSFFKYGFSNWELEKVAQADSGFVLACKNDSNINLLLINYEGELIKQTKIDDFFCNKNTEILDLLGLCYDQTILIYKTNNYSGSGCDDLFVYCLNDQFEQTAKTVFKDNLYQIQYIKTIIEEDKINIFANVTSTLKRPFPYYLCIFSYILKGNISTSAIKLPKSYVAKDILPYKYNYYITCVDSSRDNFIIKLDKDFAMSFCTGIENNCIESYFLKDNTKSKIYLINITNIGGHILTFDTENNKISNLENKLCKDLLYIKSIHLLKDTSFFVAKTKTCIKFVVIEIKNSKTKIYAIELVGDYQNPIAILNNQRDTKEVFCIAEKDSEKNPNFFGSYDIWFSSINLL